MVDGDIDGTRTLVVVMVMVPQPVLHGIAMDIKL